MMDMEFEKVKEQEGMELVDVNTTAAREHVGKIERGIRYRKNAVAVASVHLRWPVLNILRSLS